jgi:hypothetical protein
LYSNNNDRTKSSINCIDDGANHIGWSWIKLIYIKQMKKMTMMMMMMKTKRLVVVVVVVAVVE